jgi:enterochelin esterase-like enzyme
LKRLVYLIFMILLALSACAPVEVAGDTTTLLPSAVMVTPTEVVAPTETATPEPTATPTPLVCWSEGGEVLEEELRSELLTWALEFRVYLPPCYAEQPERYYPVLYLVHGQSFQHDQWDRMGVDETADELIATGEISPFLIVMPRDRVWRQPSEDKFGQAVIEDLIPYIDETYRTLMEREYRAVGGLSRGASWALHFGLSEWELFSAIGLHSLPVFWEDAPYIDSWLDGIPMEEMPRIFMDIGDHDRQEIVDSATWFEEQLTVRLIPHEFYVFSGYHEEAYWSAHLEQYLRFYTLTWHEE